MLSDTELRRVAHEIETQGFSVVEGITGKALTRRLRDELLAAIEHDQAEWGHRPQKSYDLVHNLVLHGGVFLEMLDHAPMQQVFETFLGPTSILYNYGSTFLLPGGNPGSRRIHVDTPRLIPNYHSGLIMTLALDDFTEDNGATYYLPGSQTRPDTPTEAMMTQSGVSVARKAGAAVFFNPRCFHRAGPNNTQQIRCGLTIFAARAFMKQRFDFPRMVPDDTVASLSPKARQFLGFDSRVPAHMSEFFVDEADRLYKANQG